MGWRGRSELAGMRGIELGLGMGCWHSETERGEWAWTNKRRRRTGRAGRELARQGVQDFPKGFLFQI
jgi:hypothetical protein